MIPSSDQMASDSEAVLLADAGAQREAPGGVDAAAVGREHAQAPVADLVAEALDDDGAVARHDARGLLLLAQEGEQVLRGERVEVVAVGERRGVLVDRPAANAPIASPSSFGRPTPSPFQNGTAPGTPGAGVTTTRSRVMSSIRQLDAPSRKTWPGRAS